MRRSRSRISGSARAQRCHAVACTWPLWWSLVAVFACSPAVEGSELSDWTLKVEGKPDRHVSLPQRLGTDDVPKGITAFRLERTVALPAASGENSLELVIPSLRADVVLTVDDRPVARRAARLLEGSGRHVPHVFSLPATTTSGVTAKLELIVTHDWSGSRFLATAPRLVSAEEGRRLTRPYQLLNHQVPVGGTVVAVILGFMYFATFCKDRRQRAHILFAVSAALCTFYLSWSWDALRGFLGGRDVQVAAFAVSAAVVSAVHFTHRWLNLGPPSRAWILALSVVASLAWFDSDPHEIALAPAAAALVVGAGLFYLGARSSVLGFRPKAPTESRIFSGCWILMAALGWPDEVIWLGLGDPLNGLRTGNFAFLVFLFSMALLLSVDFVRHVRGCEQLNESLTARIGTLEARRREIQALHAELRRRLSDRSAQLFDELAGAAAAESGALRTGDLFDGAYRIEAVRADDAVGHVYDAERLADGRRVRIVHARALSPSRHLVVRQAALCQVRLNHPNLAAILDVRITATNHLAIVFERPSGPALAECVPASESVRWRVLRDVAAAVEALHSARLVHGGIHLETVHVTSGNGAREPKVRLFGLALPASIEPGDEQVSEPWDDAEFEAFVSGCESGSTQILGSSSAATTEPRNDLRFGAPELAVSGSPTEASDVYAFGVLASEISSGALTHDEGDAERARSSQLSAPIVEVLARCVDPEPARRPRMSAVRAALDGATG